MPRNPHAHIPKHAPQTRRDRDIAGHAHASRTGALAVALALGVGVIEWLTAPALLPLHCVLLVALSLATGRAVASMAQRHGSSTGLGNLAGKFGTLAGLAYGLPFIIGIFIRWIRFDDAELARRIAALTNAEIANARAAGFDPFAAAFHTNQDVSYMFGYLLFGLGFGWLFGRLGALLLRRDRALQR